MREFCISNVTNPRGGTLTDCFFQSDRLALKPFRSRPKKPLIAPYRSVGNINHLRPTPSTNAPS